MKSKLEKTMQKLQYTNEELLAHTQHTKGNRHGLPDFIQISDTMRNDLILLIVCTCFVICNVIIGKHMTDGFFVILPSDKDDEVAELKRKQAETEKMFIQRLSELQNRFESTLSRNDTLVVYVISYYIL